MTFRPSLHKGDCLDVMPGIASGSVDMILTDLPYGTTGHKWDAVIDLARLWSEYDRVCKPNGAVLLFAQCPFDKVLGESNLANLRYEWVWEKNRPTGFPNARRMPLKLTENILCFYRSLPTYNPQGIREVARPKKRSAMTKKTAQFTGGSMPDYTPTHENFPTNLLPFPYERGYHPTQKPVPLLQYLIETYTNPGEVVLDSAMGSGSTMVAAMESGRRGIGIELDPKYFAMAVRRISEHQGLGQ